MLHDHATGSSDPLMVISARRKSFRIKILFRLLAACPPLVGALFVSNLGHILDYSGVFE